MDPEVHQTLAQILLVELLSYQLANPVRWTETQDVLIRQRDVDRIVEIGPSDTLTSIMAKSIAHSYPMHEARRHDRPRKLLSYNKDRDAINYELESNPGSKHPEHKPDHVPLPHPILPTPSTSKASEKRRATRLVKDCPVTAVDILSTLIAQKLRKSMDKIPQDQTIRQLTGGRSTLQNEIVGDLEAMFDNCVPARVEEVTLRDAAQHIESTKPPKALLFQAFTRLTAKFISAKMPVGFSATSIRDHLHQRWGLGPGRQEAVLLWASTQPPEQRLESDEAAVIFFNGAVETYVAFYRLDMLDVEVGVDKQDSQWEDDHPRLAGSKEAEDSAFASDVANQLQQSRSPHILDASFIASHDEVNKQKKITADLQKTLDLLHNELGADFVQGVKPLFSKLKARTYKSWWNWVVQDLLIFFNEYLLEKFVPTGARLRSQLNMVVRRSTPRVSQMLRNFRKSILSDMPHRIQQPHDDFMSLLSELQQNCVGLATTLLTSVFDDTATPDYILATQDIFNNTKTTSSSHIGCLSKQALLQDIPEFLTRDLKGHWSHNEEFSNTFRAQRSLEQNGQLSFAGKTALVTGAGPGSIAFELVRGLIAGGARALVTTSNPSTQTYRRFQELYMSHGAAGSRLIVVPFNQGSRQDVEALASYIDKDLDWALDYLVPFAAMSVDGEVDEIGSRSELAHRTMMTNTLRLVGTVKRCNQERSLCRPTGPTQIILPLSPNHGTFGRDGLYAESKIGLETLLTKWYSETWSNYLTVCGVAIGWVRGTGLMSNTDPFAAALESKGLRTFSAAEMASLLLPLMSTSFAELNESQPVYVDLCSGMSRFVDLREQLQVIRDKTSSDREITGALEQEAALARENGEDGYLEDTAKPMARPTPFRRLVTLEPCFPRVLDFKTDIQPLEELQGMVDLDKVVVITGFGEVGPFGGSRTRWEMESTGEFSLEGCVELAWITGLIRHQDGAIAGPKGSSDYYIGWVDADSGTPVHDSDVKRIYEQRLLDRCGIRLVEPDMDHNYDPHNKRLLHEVVLESDLPPFSASRDVAHRFKQEHGDKVVIVATTADSTEYSVHLRRGAVLMVPKALRFDRDIAGQIPSGWDARRYGVSDWIISQVDRTTLFGLISTVEALFSSGITDAYELYNYVHVSEVGNCIGSGLGGQHALREVYGLRHLDKDVRHDALQETFINTTAAWVNMLLLSASGPLRTPVGACATAVESLDLGYDTIMSNKAKFCIVGGLDDITEATAYEFASMKATLSPDADARKGRSASEASRPMATSRAGFVESHGAGVQVLASASLALEMGLPIRGIIAWAGTASDKYGRSVPAPGRGLLVNARELSRSQARNMGMGDGDHHPALEPLSPLLELSYRRARLDARRAQVENWLQNEERKAKSFTCTEEGLDRLDVEARINALKQEAQAQIRSSLNEWGNRFWVGNNAISPIRGALSVWGLTIDDLDVASLHGTSTVANDTNETCVLQDQLEHLGRRRGNPVLTVAQKYLTGHSKGAAGAWMINGCLQMLDSGLVPGNRNVDDAAPELEVMDHLTFPVRNVQMARGIKACSVTSFGFGQKNAQALLVHPRYLFAALSETEFKDYNGRAFQRSRKARQAFQKGVVTGTLFVPKEQAPYQPGREETDVLLDPAARL